MRKINQTPKYYFLRKLQRENQMYLVSRKENLKGDYQARWSVGDQSSEEIFPMVVFLL